MPKTRRRIVQPGEGQDKVYGGARKGAGRKVVAGVVMETGIYVRCSKEQKELLSKFVEDVSQERQLNGLPAINLSTWMRELALKYSGNEHLSMAAYARRLAETPIV